MKKASELFSLKIRREQTIFPKEFGWDGGFGCVLSKH